MATDLSPYLDEIYTRTGTRNLSKTQFNFKLPDGTVVPAAINPGSAATIQLGGGGVLDRGTTAGASIASGFSNLPTSQVTPSSPISPFTSAGAAQLSSLTGTQLAPPTPPSSASGVTQTPGFNLPSNSPTSPNTSDVNGLVAFYNKQFETLQKQQEDYQKQQETAQKAQSEQTKPFLDKLLGSKSPSEVRAGAQAETGVNVKDYFAEEKASLAELEKLNTDYNEQVALKDQAIAGSYGQLASNTFINNQIAQIERNAAPRLNQMSANIKSKAAILEAKQGRFEEAQKYVDQAVQDATADVKFNFDLFKTFYDMNQNTIDSLDKKYQDAFKTGLGLAEKAWTTSLDEKKEVGKLMIDSPYAGITLSDDLNSAYRKVSAAGGSLQFRQEQRLGGGTTGGSTNFVDVMQAAIDQGATPEEAARAAAAVSEGTGVQVDQKTLADFTAQARKLKLTPVAPPATTTATTSKPVVSNFPQPIARGVQAVEAFFSNLFGG